MRQLNRFLLLSLTLSFGMISACKPTDEMMAKSESRKAATANPVPYGKAETKTMQSVSLTQLADGVWMHRSAYEFPGGSTVNSNGLVVKDGDSLILVDTPWGEMATSVLTKKLQKETGLKIKFVVITEHHYERLAGVDWLEAQGATVYTHPSTPLLSAAAGTPVPNTSVEALGKLGARAAIGPIEIAYPGPGYTQDNLIVYVKPSNILFGGSLVRALGHTGLGNTSDADLEAWPTSLQWLRATYKDVETVVPAHGEPGDVSLLAHTAALLAKEVNAKPAAPNE